MRTSYAATLRQNTLRRPAITFQRYFIDTLLFYRAIGHMPPTAADDIIIDAAKYVRQRLLPFAAAVSHMYIFTVIYRHYFIDFNTFLYHVLH